MLGVDLSVLDLKFASDRDNRQTNFKSNQDT